MDYSYTLNWMLDYDSKDGIFKDFIEEINNYMLVMISYQNSFKERIV